MLQRIIAECLQRAQIPAGRAMRQQKHRCFLRICRHLDDCTRPGRLDRFGRAEEDRYAGQDLHIVLEPDVDIEAS